MVNFSGQLSPTEPLSHFPPSSVEEGKRKRIIKARKLGDQDKTSKQTKPLKVKNKWKKRGKNTKKVMQRESITTSCGQTDAQPVPE